MSGLGGLKKWRTPKKEAERALDGKEEQGVVDIGFMGWKSGEQLHEEWEGGCWRIKP